MRSSRLTWVLNRIGRAVFGSVAAGCALALGVALAAAANNAADAKAAPGAEEETALLNPGEGYRYLGQITPRHARDIAASNWSVGAETMDRDFTVYANWRKYLGPLGAKKARIQSGWAKTEKTPGEYDWAWLDEIIPDMVEQGVEPWVCLCYGNPIYPGGGGTGLGGNLIDGEEALAAWDRYVTAFVERYKRYVNEWEIWNEPRGGRGKAAVQYADLVIRTAQIIRNLQPEAEILFAAGGAFDIGYAQDVLEHLKQQGKLDLVNRIIYHPYAYNPDSRQAAAMKLRALVKSYADHIDIQQGENGAPSERGSFGAISDYDWTELRQAKWATRRLLGDLGRDIPTSYFAICDMRYPSRTNLKGLLGIDDDKVVNRVKKSYHAVQHITAVFDNTLTRVEEFEAEVIGGDAGDHSVFGYRGNGGGGAVTVWRHTDSPGKNPTVETIGLTIPALKFDQPVLVDLVSGRVYAVDPKLADRGKKQIRFRDVPVYDSVVVLADRSVIEHVLEEK
ncbi:MAG: hypothetical protein RBS80_03750 [Thermoguttaceae bacterium]|nr:hypothetical protein [Thermoguttaceae bacterium]